VLALMNQITLSFPPDFATAQARFREAIAACGGRLDSLQLTAKGSRGETLAIDIGWFGATNPRRVLVHSSGLHGVEGFAGSAIQLQYLDKGIPQLPDDAAIVIVHVLNPYGMAWLRRVNENNIDLNRNFRATDDDGADLGNDYIKLDTFLNPRSVPRLDLFYLQATWLLLRHGMSNLRQTVAGGQCIRPKGLFYVGKTPEQNVTIFQDYLEKRLQRPSRIVAIDVHTGLGRYGYDQLLVDAMNDRAGTNQTMRETFGERVQLLDKRGIAYRVRGAQSDMYYRLFPKSKVYFAGQEFGTFHPFRVLAALRAENCWHHYGDGTLNHPCKRRLVDVFCPDDEGWRVQLLERGREVINQAYALAFEQ
jgi:hypothetical protein